MLCDIATLSTIFPSVRCLIFQTRRINGELFFIAGELFFIAGDAASNTRYLPTIPRGLTGLRR